MSDSTTVRIIDGFTGEWRLLSNFASTPLVFQQISYPTAAHAYQAAKTLDPAVRRQVADARSPGAAKRLGRFVDLRPDWSYVRVAVMWHILRVKFTPYPDRLDVLRSTGDAHLVEGNLWHDQFWGDCHCARRACAEPGENHLGRLLATLRTEAS